MRTTTICRSSVLLAALVAAAPLSAQNPPAIQRPIDQARRAANQTNAQTAAQQNTGDSSAPANNRVQIISGQQPGAMGQQTPSTHVVAQGETLWALAQQFLGDPLLWPEIYRLNTDVVEDPHWIYPGEELRLGPAPATVSSDPTPVTPADSGIAVSPSADTMPTEPVRYSTQGPTIFSEQTVARIGGAGLELRESRAYRAVREGEYYSSGFLTENQPLNSGRILANLQTSALGSIRTRESAYQFEHVVIGLPTGDAPQQGDLLLAFRRTGETERYGEIVRPTGLLRYQGPANDRHIATVVRQFGQIADGQELIKVGLFMFNTSARAVPVQNGLQGTIVAMRDPREVVVLQDIVFIDKGDADGVRMGDIFQVYRTIDEAGAFVEQDQARALIVSTRNNTATAIIIEVYRGDVGPASLVRQIRRMPS